MDAAKVERDLVITTRDIIVAFVQHNTVSPDTLPGLIERVHESLSRISDGPAEVVVEPPAQEPAVPIRRSITPDYLVCLEDGKKMKVMTRHLRTRYGLTPEQYRQKWNLPADYPMTAPNYAKTRSELALKLGLGQSRKRKVVGE